MSLADELLGAYSLPLQLQQFGESISFIPVDGDPVPLTASVIVQEQAEDAEGTLSTLEVASVRAMIDPDHAMGGVRQPRTGDKFYRSESNDPLRPEDKDQRAFVYSHETSGGKNDVYWSAVFHRRRIQIAGRGVV